MDSRQKTVDSKGVSCVLTKTRTNYEQAKFIRRGLNQLKHFTQMFVAELNAKYEYIENIPDPKADKPAKAEETFNAGSSKKIYLQL